MSDIASQGWGTFEDEPSEAPAAEEPRRREDWGMNESSSDSGLSSAPLSAEAGKPAAGKTAMASYFLVCCLGSQQYALPIDCVREILEYRKERALPQPREGILGLVTLRGQTFPIIDVSRILYAKRTAKEKETRASDGSDPNCMIVCEVDRKPFCFAVDEVKQVIPTQSLTEEITPLLGALRTHKAISHVSQYDKASILFVDMAEVIPA